MRNDNLNNELFMLTIKIFIMEPKRIFLSIVFSVIFIFSFSQSETSFYVEYEYDDAGNRISRTTIEMPKLRDSTNNEKEFLAEEHYLHEIIESASENSGNDRVLKYETGIADYNIAVYPNPVEDILIINISGTEKIKNANIQLICISGKIMYNEIIHDNNKILDFGNIPVGTYILKIFINNKPSEFKIVRN